MAYGQVRFLGFVSSNILRRKERVWQSINCLAAVNSSISCHVFRFPKLRMNTRPHCCNCMYCDFVGREKKKKTAAPSYVLYPRILRSLGIFRGNELTVAHSYPVRKQHAKTSIREESSSFAIQLPERLVQSALAFRSSIFDLRSSFSLIRSLLFLSSRSTSCTLFPLPLSTPSVVQDIPG